MAGSRKRRQDAHVVREASNVRSEILPKVLLVASGVMFVAVCAILIAGGILTSPEAHEALSSREAFKIAALALAELLRALR